MAATRSRSTEGVGVLRSCLVGIRFPMSGFRRFHLWKSVSDRRCGVTDGSQIGKRTGNEAEDQLLLTNGGGDALLQSALVKHGACLFGFSRSSLLYRRYQYQFQSIENRVFWRGKRRFGVEDVFNKRPGWWRRGIATGRIAENQWNGCPTGVRIYTFTRPPRCSVKMENGIQCSKKAQQTQ